MLITVNKRDGSKEKVLLVPLQKWLLVEYADHCLHADESKFVELICARPQGWSDTLTLESIEQLVAAGLEMNQERAKQAGITLVNIFDRRRKALEVATIKTRRALEQLTQG